MGSLSLMIQGTASSVGKSLLTAAFCRIFRDEGLDVVPFKAQNMALNSFVTPDGCEIGRAQALQALAAGLPPAADMNPILLKPEADSKSQVIVMGKPWKTLPAGTYYTHREELWVIVTSALDRLKKEHELIVIEGAGSPAEINFSKTEIVNMAVARYLKSPVLLAGNIDVGGVFAAFVGTLALLDEYERSLVKGFIINRFRGDERLLAPGLSRLSELTQGRPTLGVIPFIRGLRLAEEDSVCLDDAAGSQKALIIDIAVIHLPHMANFDDFDALAAEDGVRVRFIRDVSEAGTPHAVIIPGTKTTIEDLLWMGENGFADMLSYFRRLNIAIVGICGGYQMLGRAVKDPDGVEGGAREARGLGFFPFETRFKPGKKTVQSRGTVVSGGGFLSAARGISVCGYEIHAGESGPLENAVFSFSDGTRDGSSSLDGRIWGTYLHGVFDLPGFRRVWLSSLCSNFSGSGKSLSELREEELGRLADTVRSHLDMGKVRGIIGL